jgi:cobalt/nickel transport system permease protein
MGFLFFAALAVAVQITESFQIIMTAESIRSAIYLFVKSSACVSCLYLLTLSTPVEHILAMLDKLKIPKIFIEMMMMILRFIFIVYEYSRDLVVAQKSRLSSESFSSRMKASASLFSTVFIKSFMKAEDIYSAMLSRAYVGDYTYVSSEKPEKHRSYEIILVCYICVCIVTVVIVRL